MDVAKIFRPDAKILLLYDLQCPVCRRSVAFLGRRSGAERLQLMPLQTPGILDALGVREEDALRELHAVDRTGHLYLGAEAVFRGLSALPRWFWVGALLKVPGVLPLSSRVYLAFASRRTRDDCETGVCGIARHASAAPGKPSASGE
jgi:predicted DCC family thiol-disulfide oxidoreductase YuxK